MKAILEVSAILASIAIAVVFGFLLYAVIEHARLSFFCRELREGFDCYQQDWVAFPVWLFSLVGGCIAVLSISLVSHLRPATRIRSCKLALGVGTIIAFPLTMLVSGPIAFTATALSGFIALQFVMWSTKRSSKGNAHASRLSCR